MAKDSLKESLKKIKAVDAYNAELKKQEAIKAGTKVTPKPKVVKSAVKAQPAKKTFVKKAKVVIPLEDKSTLSKKEQRQLKKQTQKAEEEVAEEVVDEEESEDEEDSETEKPKYELARIEESDSDSDEDLMPLPDLEDDEEEEDEEEEEEEEDIPLSDVELDDDADIIPYQKVTINNRAALEQALAAIALPLDTMRFVEHQSITYDQKNNIEDVHDDIKRELEFYKQGLSAANIARDLLKKDNLPFARPTDYFAEMLKSDEHMDRLKAKMVEEATNKLASQEAKRQRELKKFGKKVQHNKLQERQKEKRETLDKIKSLKRKRQGNEISGTDFDIAIEDAASYKSEQKGGDKRGRNFKREAKDKKFGSGGKKRFKNSNDAESSNDMSGFNQKKMKGSSSSSKGPAKRPGKSKRMNRRS